MLGCRGGASPARDFAATRNSQVSNVGRGLAPSLLFCGSANLPDISPSSGAYRATSPPKGKAFAVGSHTKNTM